MNRRLPFRATQKGITLAELLVTVTISILVLAGLTHTLNVALATATASRSHNEVQARIAFALERIARTIEKTPPKELSKKSSPETSADWLDPVKYELNAGSLIETDAAGSRTIADGVTGFSITAPSVAAGRRLIVVQLTVSEGDMQARGDLVQRLGGPV